MPSPAPVGGANGKGMIYELTPNADGSWTETVLYSFSDSFEPYPSVAILDASGNLYGTTEFGGTKGFGTVFELTPSAGGGWTETVLHTFTGQDGGFPGSLIFDAAGNLYGTSQSGANGHGGIFELKPAAGGAWVEKMIYGFPILGRYGIAPAGLTIDKAGKLYGTTFAGGSSHCNNEGTLGCGTVFELTRNASGKWTETLLYSFSNTGGDGNNPTSAPVFDAAGNLYGITSGGGANSLGAVFELTPAADGSWTETVLHSFSRSGGDGYVPVGGAVLDSAGRVYGATGSGGNGMCKASDGCGTIFEITP